MTDPSYMDAIEKADEIGFILNQRTNKKTETLVNVLLHCPKNKESTHMARRNFQQATLSYCSRHCYTSII